MSAINRRAAAARLRAKAYEALAQAEHLEADELEGAPVAAEAPPAPPPPAPGPRSKRKPKRVRPLPRPLGPVDELAVQAARRDLLRLGVR